MAASTARRTTRSRGAPKTYTKPIGYYDDDGNYHPRKMSDREAAHHADLMDRKHPTGLNPDDVEHPQIRKALIDQYSRESDQAEHPEDHPAESPSSGGGFSMPSFTAPLSTDDASGWVLGAFVYAAFISPYLTGGMTTVKQWWRAKFLNETSSSSSSAPLSTAAKELLTNPTSATPAPGSTATDPGSLTKLLGQAIPPAAKQGKSTAGNAKGPVVAAGAGTSTPSWLQTLEGL